MAARKFAHDFGLLRHLGHHSSPAGFDHLDDKTRRPGPLKLSEVQVAIVASILFCIFFSYLPNDGLMVRQRVQVAPATC